MRIVALHRDLLRLRRRTRFRAQNAERLVGAVLSAEALVLRFFGAGGDDRLLLVNFGRDLHLDPAPEPLWPPSGSSGRAVDERTPRYGGDGTPPLDTEENSRIPGQATVALEPRPAPPEPGRLPLTGKAHK